MLVAYPTYEARVLGHQGLANGLGILGFRHRPCNLFPSPASRCMSVRQPLRVAPNVCKLDISKLVSFGRGT